MTATIEPTANAGKVRWHRRRPPVTFDRFQRGVWWAGHAQLYIAWVFAILGPAMFITYYVAAAPTNFYDGLRFYDVLLVLSYPIIGMAAPFWLSGRMLRGYAQLADEGNRGLRLAGTILGIAVVSIIATFASILLFFLGFGYVFSIIFSALTSP